MLNGKDYMEEVKRYRPYIDLALEIFRLESPAQLKVSIIDMSEHQKLKSVDELLDEYNDHMRKFKEFGDSKYELKAKHALETLRHLNYICV